MAEAKNLQLKFEAAVAGGIPIVTTLREALIAHGVDTVKGILNGTCNYILTRMGRENLSFGECLRDAQRLGYAEADPSFDVEGHDTAQKLAILASLAFGTRVDPDAVYVEGIASITPEDLQAADELGYRIKLLGVAVKTENGIEQRVHPTMVPKGSAIAQVMEVTNAVTIDADAVREITLVGPGAGGEATASAVISDIGDVARGVRVPPFGRPTAGLTTSEKAPMQRHEGGYYIRMLAVDRPGTAARIATHLADESISLESIVQRHPGSRPHGGDDPKTAAQPVPVILITYATTEDAVRRALACVEAEKVIVGKPQLIRIEKT
jgi:homoserine dehydrogenase